ncbi:unnamed protein product [Arctogadus glacialis]
MTYHAETVIKTDDVCARAVVSRRDEKTTSVSERASRRLLSCALSARRRQGSAAGDGNTTCQKASVAKP